MPKANGFLIYKTMFLNPFRIPDPKLVPTDVVKVIADRAKQIQENNTHLIAVEKTFAALVDTSLPVPPDKAQNFQRDYYNIPHNWTARDFLIDNPLQLKDTITAIKLDNTVAEHREQFIAGNTLRLSFKSTPLSPWRAVLQLQPATDDLRMFVLLGARRFIRENSRKKEWKLSGKRASLRTLDVLLQSIVLPIWKFGPGTQMETTQQRVAEIIAALRERFPGKEINPSVLDAENEAALRDIDRLTATLYGLDTSSVH